MSFVLGATVLAGCALSGAREADVDTAFEPDVVASEFDRVVRPILMENCAGCHTDTNPAGGMSVAGVTTEASLAHSRDTWEAIMLRLRAGTMPPPGMPRPDPVRLSAMMDYVEDAFDRADAALGPDPGRMVAHRLNRTEYMNTVYDLLGVRFRADRDFPADDSGAGFDNMADLLSLSPLLMERYMDAAERIARWAISTHQPDQLLEIDYRSRDDRITRMGRSAIEANHRVDFDGEYIVRFELPGERPEVDGVDAEPVTLGFWMDDVLLETMTVETKPSGLVYFSPYSEEEMRLHLPAGDHTFRAAFIDDDFVRELPDEDVFNDRRNKYLSGIVFVGPFPSSTEKPSRQRILSCDPASGQACVERILTDLAGRAYRRPATERDVESLVRFVDLAMSSGQSAEEGIELAIQAILVSPHFLFRIEHDPDPLDPTDIRQVSPFELASRLSYFLWSSMPDDELFALAETGELQDPDVLEAQVDRMLADPRAAAFAENFAGQWLETKHLDGVRPDPDLFGEWDAELREAMQRETTLFFEYVLRENRPVSDFVNANYTFLNERLASHYGIEGVTGSEFRRVELTNNRRGGILTQGAVLTVSSFPTRTSAVLRGHYVLTNLLGTPPPPPPPNVPTLEEASSNGELGSMREQLEIHRANPACSACHSNMDPLGFGLENYDAIGRWREQDGEHPIDPSGTLPNGQSFTTATEMLAVLQSQLPQISQTLSDRMLTYALRRSLQTYDRRALQDIQRAVAEDDYRFRTMVHEVVKSFPFQSRRGEDTTDDQTAHAN